MPKPGETVIIRVVVDEVIEKKDGIFYTVRPFTQEPVEMKCQFMKINGEDIEKGENHG